VTIAFSIKLCCQIIVFATVIVNTVNYLREDLRFEGDRVDRAINCASTLFTQFILFVIVYLSGAFDLFILELL
jgi:hypothetical protein